MNARSLLVTTTVVLLASSARPTLAQDNGDATLMLAQPAVSTDRIAFAYAGDLWIAGIDGRSPRRLTSHIGVEFNPRFSPDGEWIAFSGEYDGNTDVFLVHSDGGVPTRLTWHPSADIVQGFTTDGSAVLFASGRNAYTGRHQQLFTISTSGGRPDQLPIPHAFKATYSPDGSKIAYTPLYEAFTQWKNYRGGTATRIWIYDVADHSVVQVPQPEGRSNDTDPMWIGDLVYFRSDRDGEFNIYSYDPEMERVARLTSHEDFPVLSASAGAGRIAYEQAGRLHLLDPVSGSTGSVPVEIATDLVEVRSRYASGENFVRDASLSPSGARAVFEFRGEIVTLPRDKGDDRNLTQSTSAHERSPAWSPDGESIAWFSDDSGEYRLYVALQTGAGEARSYALDGAGFYADPMWSPDGTNISYTDNSRAVYWIDLAAGQTHRVDADVMYGPLPPPSHAWSPDSRWLVYTRNNETNIRTAYAYRIETGETRALTDGLSEVSEAVFDASGKYIYLTSSTDAGPVVQWFAQSNNDFEMTNAIYLVVLEKGTPSPLARESGRRGRRWGRRGGRGGRRSRRGRCEHRLRRTGSADPRPPVAGSRLLEPPARRPGTALLHQERNGERVRKPRFRSQPAPLFPLRPGGEDPRRRHPLLRTVGRPQDRALCNPGADGSSGMPAGRTSDRARTGSRSGMWRCRSIRERSGGRSTTRRGGSTATTSTIRTCTARIGRPSRKSTPCFCPTLPPGPTSTRS